MAAAHARLIVYVSEDGQMADLTGNQLSDLSSVSFPSTLTELDLTENRLSRPDPRIADLTSLRKLSLRQNVIADDAAAELATYDSLKGLQELVFRDNQLTRIPPLAPFTSLRILDVSYNEIVSVEGLRHAPPSLTELYVTNQTPGLPKLGEMAHLTQLRLLEAGSNKIRVMEELGSLTQLEELWLGRNRIREVKMCGLTRLRKVSVQSNRLTSMLGFEACTLLEELYLSHNGISVMEGLASLVRLRVLDVSSNRIVRLEHLDTLKSLEDLWVNDNQLASLDEVERSLSEGPGLSLVTLYLEGNPCAKEKDYATHLQRVLPNIREIDTRIFG